MKITLLGTPGAGKGTQAGILSKKLALPTVSTGNILRAAVAADSTLGHEVGDLIACGELVRDDLVMDLLQGRIHEPDCNNGYILDGVPRTLVQAETMEVLGIEVDYCILFNVDDSIIIDRLSGRRTCPRCGDTYHIKANPPKTAGVCNSCGTELYIRPDDTEATIRRRLEIFRNRTEILVEFYRARHKLKVIPSAGTVEETTAQVLAAIGYQ